MSLVFEAVSLQSFESSQLIYLSTEMSASVTGVIRLKLSVIVISHMLNVEVQSAMKSLLPCLTKAVHLFPFEHKS
jgi:hypothetical protein